jgi:hypothetical protein
MRRLKEYKKSKKMKNYSKFPESNSHNPNTVDQAIKNTMKSQKSELIINNLNSFCFFGIFGSNPFYLLDIAIPLCDLLFLIKVKFIIITDASIFSSSEFHLKATAPLNPITILFRMAYE